MLYPPPEISFLLISVYLTPPLSGLSSNVTSSEGLPCTSWRQQGSPRFPPHPHPISMLSSFLFDFLLPRDLSWFIYLPFMLIVPHTQHKAQDMVRPQNTFIK